jgi:hypothetical protein
VSTKRFVEGAVSLNTNEVLMRYIRIKIIQERAAQVNKATYRLASLYGMRTGSQALVTEGEETGPSWTLLVTEVWEGSWK